MKQKSSKKPNSLLIVILIIVAFYVGLMLSNLSKGSYAALSEIDQNALNEVNTFFESEQESPLWEDYKLSEHTILAINKEGLLHYAYLINPEKEVHSPFAKKINLPKDFSIDAYRISAVSPQMLQFLLPNNFNTLHKEYTVCGNSVYFVKYDADSFGKPYDSRHFITFLSHEAFHYYMQNNWAGGERFDTSDLTDEDLELMEPLYKVYDELLKELEKTPVDQAKLTELAKQYVALSAKRYEANPSYMKAESLTETAEGTATYIGLHASKAVDYEFGIMTVNGPDNKKLALPVDLIVSMLKSGELDKSTVASNFVYDTGALLCELLDALDVKDWQKTLNQQTVEEPITLYTLLADYVNE